ncbi:MAG TPA: hypothetical protein PLP34_06525, partial [Chitinophagaceae bacterium]|nr:hypothetical protein [Chitinophagaceae bacterium]
MNRNLHLFRLLSILPLLWVACLPDQLNAQTPQTVVIGNTAGTNSYFYGPIVRASSGSVLNYSRHAYLYTAAELNIPSGAKIIKLEWLKNNTFTVTGNNTFNMWLGNTTATTLPTNSAWGTLLQGMTQVYSSTTFSVT